ncbi:hypothetical protein I551_9062 [Mycobacterium ulcerans str. Harvey]|uniref:DDE_Tnp_1-associated family protein n=1 Tax=Mycobacterium ulcerans str. Harvey TaxID=1299332 RepID=A0ABN0R9D7_MYCUL|nr:hypothetical protein I551_9062 [Mycobacterium ulcerans str. Harvey]
MLPFSIACVVGSRGVRPLSAGERSELHRIGVLDVLARCQTRGPRGRRYSLMALLAIAVLALRGDARLCWFAHGRTASDDVLPN